MSTETPAPTFVPAEHERGDLLWDPAAFIHGQRVAQMFAASQLVPKHLQGKVADIVIGLHMARRMNEDPLTVLQSIYVVHGKPGWSAQYMIARANRSGIFRGPLRWRESGKAGAPDYAVTCYATLAETGEDVDFTVPYQMAVDEGWAKQNPKYRSMPQLMLRYRSATMLVRLYAPEVMLGLQTVEEIRDVGGADEVVVAPERIRIEADPYITPEPAPQPAQPARGMAALRQAVADEPTVIEAPKPAPAAKPDPAPVPDEPPPEPKPEPKPTAADDSPTGRALVDAEVLRQVLEGQMSDADLRAAFRARLGIARVSEARWQMAFRAATRAGYVRKVGEGVWAPAGVVDETPVADAPEADDDLVRTPETWHGPEGEELLGLVIEAEQALGEVATDARDRILRARRRAQCSDPAGADEDAVRRYSIALEDELSDLGMEE